MELKNEWQDREPEKRRHRELNEGMATDNRLGVDAGRNFPISSRTFFFMMGCVVSCD